MVDGGDNFVHADWKSVSGMLNLVSLSFILVLFSC